MYLPTSPDGAAQSVALLLASRSPSSHLLDDAPDNHSPSPGGVSQYSPVIGIVTAVVGNILIALALNVQRYAHTRLHHEKKYAKERARQALRNTKTSPGRRGYGALDDTDTESSDRLDLAADEADESDPLISSNASRWSDASDDDEMPKAPSTYLKSPYWWLGQILITVGESGNFLAYGFAPASIVSPLGVVALISNCVIAPILFKEQFRKRDFWGVAVAVAGAVTVVLSADTEEAKLDPPAVWEHIASTGFEIYMGVTCVMIALLMWMSPKYGNRSILVDLGLVGLLGSYTALSTKGISSMLSSTLFKAFTTPVTYLLILILLGTAIMQVRYVNKALQRFDSTQVIPIQFVVFTLCVIIGSAVLYRDFERTTPDRVVKFVGGCILTFFGVFLITSGRPPSEDDDEEILSDDEGVEETLRLAEQDPHGPQTPPPRPNVRGNEGNGRRSSKVSFVDALNKPLAVVAKMDVPSSRSQPGAASSTPLVSAAASESTPLPPSPPRDVPTPAQPLVSHAMSSVSAVTVSSATPVHSEPETRPETPPQNPPVLTLDTNTLTTRPSVLRPRSSHRFSSHLFSPSPFDSTLRGLVPATLLDESPQPTSRRRLSRPTLRASLYVSQDELEQDGEETGAINALQRSRTHESSPVEGPRAGFRNRAKSLSHTVTDLFNAKKRRASRTDASAEEEVGTSSQTTTSTATL